MTSQLIIRSFFPLNPQIIITTNYDLIPNYLTTGYRIFSNRQITEALRAINSGKKIIVKLHGDIQDQDSIILTSKDYARIMDREDVRNIITTIFTSYTVTLLGFGLSDPHITLILKLLNDIHKGMGQHHYALLPNLSDFQAQIFENNYAVKVIPYKPSAPTHPEVSSFLDILKTGDLYFSPEVVHNNNQFFDEFDHHGIIKLTDSPTDRISDYKNCLMEAEGTCFISGTSMIHLAEDSSDILKDKLHTGEVYLLILDPDWIAEHYSILTFISAEEDRQDFQLRDPKFHSKTKTTSQILTRGTYSSSKDKNL